MVTKGLHMTDRKLFRYWLRWLRKHFPLNYPCRVLLVERRLVPSKGEGQCVGWHYPPSRQPTGFTIYIDRA